MKRKLFTLNILQLNTFDTLGGAARAAFRLHQALRDNNVNSWMLVQFQDSDNQYILSPTGFWGHLVAWVRSYLDVIPLKFYTRRNPTIFSPGWVPDVYLKIIRRQNPDIVHLHWINGGFIRLESISRMDLPIVWTLHDMWAFSGGCHYSGTCKKYTEQCGQCQILGSTKKNDLSRRGWKRKERIFKKMNLTIVTPSNWLANQAKQSSLLSDLRIEVIPNGIDLTRFKPMDKYNAREVLNLPQDKRLILFGAQQEVKNRKGGDLLQAAITHLSVLNDTHNYEVVLFGGGSKDFRYDIQVNHMGVLKDEISLSLLYSAVDVFVAPSRQDNLPNTILESMACGTPCAAFNIGGIPDMIDHRKNGYLAQPFQTEELAAGLKWILEDDQRHQKLSKHARQKAIREYDQNLQAERHKALYQDLIK